MGVHYDDTCGGDGECEEVEREPDCVDGLRHAWTRAGMGGCKENPGVWSFGGTAYQFRARCRLCGCVRTEIEYGSQRNPYQCDSVRYRADGATVDAEEAQAERARQRRNRAARARYAKRAAEVRS